jgi:hypothetical protein
MKSPSIAYDDGEATTLMSTDADSLDGIAEMVHETWAQVIEVLIGIGLLASEVGWIWPLPLFLIYCKYICMTFCVDTETCSMFIHESFCCKAFTASPKGLEQRNAKPHSCYQLYAKRNERCQNAWTPTQIDPSH